MDSLYRLTSLGRPLDPRYPTNLAIIVLSLIGGLVAGLLAVINEQPTNDVLSVAIVYALVVFFGWALARELNPDQPLAAFFAAGLAYLSAFFVDPPDFLVLVGVLLMLRIVSRTVGPPAKLTDTLAAVGLTALIIFTDTWVFGLVAITAFLLDSSLQNPHQFHIIGAVAVAGLMGVYFLMNGTGAASTLSQDYTVIELGITALFILAIVTVNDTRTTADATGELLAVHRIHATMGLGLMACIVMLWDGDAGFIAMVPLWATLLAVALYRLLIPRFRRGTDA